MADGYTQILIAPANMTFGTGTTAAVIPTTCTIGSTATDGVAGTGSALFQYVNGPLAVRVIGFGMTMTTAVTSTSPVLNLISLPTYASDATSARTIGSLTIPNTAVANDVWANFGGAAVATPTTPGLTNVDLNPGERLQIFLRTKGGGTGAGIPFVMISGGLFGSPGNVTTSIAKPIPTATGAVYYVAA